MRNHRLTDVLVSATISVLFSAFLLPLFTGSVLAQATTGSIWGTVKDTTGAVVGEAAVAAKNKATGVESPTYKTTGDGFYVVPNLIPGRYSLIVQAQGFKRVELTDIDVRLGQESRVDAELQPGAITEVVNVTASTETSLQRGASQGSASFDSRMVGELPSNLAGSGVDTLALLVPGVTPGFGTVNSNGTPLSVNGNRATSNNFNIDGQDNNDQLFGGQIYAVDNQDLVADYQVITNNFSAQYGRNMGSIINIVTKSGANDFHGAGFWFHRDRKLFDSRTNIEVREDVKEPPPQLYNVYGATLGGPIVKDKAFFFASYQGITTRQQTFTTHGFFLEIQEPDKLKSAFPGNPAIAALADFSAFANPQFGTVGVDTKFPFSGKLNIGGKLFDAARPVRTFPFTDETPYNQNEFSLRGDIKISQKDSVWGRYLFQDYDLKNFLGQFGGFTSDFVTKATGGSKGGETVFGTNSNGFTGDYHYRSRGIGGTWDRQISSRGINEFSLAYSTIFSSFGGRCSGLNGCIPDARNIDHAITSISAVVPGTFSFGTDFSFNSTSSLRVGPSNIFPSGHRSDVAQFRDNYSLTLGKHQVILGADIRRQRIQINKLALSNGSFSFSSANNAASLVANTADSFSLRVGPDTITYHETDQFYYIQDDWKWRDNLTLNLGLRYEYTGQPFNKLHELTVKRESDSATALWLQSVSLEDRTVPEIRSDKNNWAPRIGLAFTPRFWKKIFGQDATVIRAGYSIAYDLSNYLIARDVSGSAPMALGTSAFKSAGAVIRVPGVPTGANVRSFAEANGLISRSFDPRLFGQTVIPQNFHSPYSQQWAFGIQRQIRRNSIAEVRYLGNHGIGLIQAVDRNPIIANLVQGFAEDVLTGFAQNGAPTFKTVNFPGFPNLLPPGTKPQSNGRLLSRGSIVSYENTGQSTYHSLQSRYYGQLFNQVTLGASYTLSKARDNVSEIREFQESAFAQNPFDINRGESSFSGFDRRHVLAMNGIWDIPFFKEQRGILGRLFGGWQINGIYELASGLRFTPSQFPDGFYSFRPLRPFNGNSSADPKTVAITDIDASLFFFVPLGKGSPTGFYSVNELNRTGNLVPVSPNDVRYIFNGPGAAVRFGTPFGDVERNSLIGPKINVVNAGFFKNTRIGEKKTIQFRTEVLNLFNHPNPGYGFIFSSKGSIDGRAIPDRFIEEAGITNVTQFGFNDRSEMEFGRRVIQFGLRFTF